MIKISLVRLGYQILRGDWLLIEGYILKYMGWVRMFCAAKSVICIGAAIFINLNCAQAQERKDTSSVFSYSKSDNVGYVILDIEGEIPGQPSVKQELKRLIERVVKEVKTSGGNLLSDERARAIATFEAIAGAVKSMGFHHEPGTYPTSLTSVLSSGSKLFDCDTGSFIFLSIGDELALPMSMVEVEVPEYSPERAFGDHSFVRWTLTSGGTVDWDPNAERQRSGDIQKNLYGYAWNKDQLIGYSLFARGLAWEKGKEFVRAIADYEKSINLFPKYIKQKNNVAWLLSTRRELAYLGRKKDALALALEVVSVDRTPNSRDTLACAYALNEDFNKAVEIEENVVREIPHSKSFRENLEKFRNSKNCFYEN